jgi:hypothetical protein
MKRCTDCQAGPGEEHGDGCDVARCLAYGTQRLQCGDGKRLVVYGLHPWGSPIVDYVTDGHDCGRDVWTGRWPGEAECEEYGLWAVFVPDGDPSWQPVPAGTPGAVPDLNRLLSQGRWDAGRRSWVWP